MIRGILTIIEIAILSVLILATRCANYQDVFVAGNIYFTDADCYARMTRVRMCSEHPGLIVRHHDFENFPTGTTPHTTAPLDYLILALSILLKPVTAHAIDLAGALISPLLALLGGWFLWWWSKRMKFRYRWVMLIAVRDQPHSRSWNGTRQTRSSIVADAARNNRDLRRMEPAMRGDRRLGQSPLHRTRRWSIVSGVAWGLAIWTSAYESLVLFLLVTVVSALKNQKRFRPRLGAPVGFVLFSSL